MIVNIQNSVIPLQNKRMLHNEFELLGQEEKLACLMLMRFKSGDLRVDSKQSSISDLYRLTKENSVDKPEKKKAVVKKSPSKSKSIDKLDKLSDEDSKSQCHICLRTFNRKYELERHLKTVHVEPVKCGFCLKHLKLMNRRDMQRKHLMFRCPEYLASGVDIDAVDLEATFSRLLQ